jgi:(4S)-4-hydroxy-5-phosphonooxypentane-2,3-dione isomerase
LNKKFHSSVEGAQMVVTTVIVQVKAEHIDDFIKESTKNHLNSIKEPGNRRFDILQSTENPTEFLLYEAYDTQESAAAHKKTSHYEAWREAVAPWMAQARKGIPYNSICP